MDSVTAAPAAQAPTTAIASTNTHEPLRDGVFIVLELNAIHPSNTPMQKARRAHFNRDALAEMAATIKAHGVLEPVLVRGIGDKGYELVAGERRYLASKLAGATQIPAIVRKLTDLQVVEMQVIENNQREDLHELVEAEGFEQLIKVHKLTADDIAAKIGKSKSYVYGRLKFCALCPEARQAFYDGKISASVALEIARHIHPHDQQRKALKEVTATRPWDPEPMSFRRAAEHIRNNYLVKLSAAPFDIKSETLVPKAGSCTKCPKRTGNQPQLFADEKIADVCTDAVCFAAKRAAHADQLVKAAAAKGQTVIAGKDAKKIAPHGAQHGLTGYKRLDDMDWSSGKHRKVRDIVGKAHTPTLLQDPKSGDLVEVVSHDQIKKALIAKGIHRTNTRSGSASVSPQQKAANAKRDLENQIRDAYDERLLGECHARWKGPLQREDLEAVAVDLADAYGNGDAFDKLYGKKRLDDKAAKAMKPDDLARLIVISLACDDSKLRDRLAERLKIDTKALRLTVTEEIKSKNPQLDKPPATAKSKKAKPASAGLPHKFMQRFTPDAALAAVVGTNPLARTEITKKIWSHIKKHGLQDKKTPRMINADEKLKPVFGGKAQVSMFEMTKFANKHMTATKAPAKKKAAKK